MVYEFEFKYESLPNIWLRTDVTVEEALHCIKTGLLRNEPVSQVKLFAITEGSESVSFVYDIINAKKGNSPWSLLNTQ